MIKNYFKTAIRNIIRYPTYAIVNISGIAIGMTCAILLLLWVQYQLSYDRHYKNADCLFRVLERHYTTDGKLHQMALTAYPLATALKEEYPEILRSSRYHNFWKTFIKGDDFIEGTLATVDSDFLEMFDITFVEGDKVNALKEPENIVITEDMANKYFDTEDPLGKKMNLDINKVFTVTGVIKNVPRNSHIYIDCIVSSEYLKQIVGNLDDWKNLSNYTFIELIKGSDSKLVEKKIKDIYAKKSLTIPGIKNPEIFLQDFRKIHLYSHGKYEMDIESGSIVQVRLAILIAVLILAIACINFMNLLTAQSAARAKEIGVRKIAGANRRIIISQFLGESMLIIIVAQVIAMILVELLLPVFNTVMYSSLKIHYQSAGLYIILITVILFCGLLAGSYPALYLSSLQPVDTLKGNIIKNSGKAKFRRLLVIFQYTLAFIFIISTLFIKSQLKYMNSTSGFGADLHDVVNFEFNDGVKRESLKKELSSNPNVYSVSVTDHQYILNNWSTIKGLSWEGKKGGDNPVFTFLAADKDYAKTFKICLRKGNYLPADDYSIDNSVMLINERAAEVFGFTDPIGETIVFNDSLKMTIIGVVNNFHFKSFHFPIDPLLIVPLGPAIVGGQCFVRINPDSIASTVNYIRRTFKSLKPDYPLKIGFLEDDYSAYNRIELIAGNMFGYFSFLTIVISILGLIGLSTFMTFRRTKEIGIRKVHGSKTSEIFIMLSKEYFILAGISFIIAAPIAFLATNIWLQSFAYHVNPNLWLFVFALIIVTIVTILTVGAQSYYAAHRNPVETLRYE